MPTPAMSKSDLLAAQTRIHGHVRLTPTLHAPDLNALAGANLWLKAENLQHIGAFKARGAFHCVSQLSKTERARGLVTYSSGNHGQAVAWAAQRFGLTATIFMPTDAPAVKAAAVKRMGATIVSVGTTSLERQVAALDFAATTGAIVVEPFDNEQTIAGQGTAFLEMQSQVEQASGAVLDQVFVPIGGGGLIAGACLAFEDSPTEIIGVEPKGCDSMRQSLIRNTIVDVVPGPTLADGLKPTRVGALNFSICKDRLSRVILVDDEELSHAFSLLLMRVKLVVEPSGAAALAAALKAARQGAHVGVLLSGGNLAQDTVVSLLQSSRDSL